MEDQPAGWLQRDLFGGQGEVRVWDLLGATAIAPFQAVLACELAPGASVGTHVQEHFPEIVVVIGGTATISVDGEARLVGAGGLVALPLGATLAIANPDATLPVNYMIIKAGP